MFHSVQIVASEAPQLSHSLRLGVKYARAQVIAFTEDHAFPAPNWAERLLAAHSKPYTAVGPAMRNADPSTLVSWADFYMGYGKWAEPIQSGEIDFLMEHNSSYKRSSLLEYGDRLEQMLESETVMQYEMARKGQRFWLEATTYTAHMCYGKWGPWLDCMQWHGRIFAARRANGWGLAHRALYFFGAPFIPFVRLNRIRRPVARSNFSIPRRLQLLSAIFVGLVAEAFGQALGYAFGDGGTSAQSLKHEFHRERHRGTMTPVSAE
jgi:hypothetical protein